MFVEEFEQQIKFTKFLGILDTPIARFRKFLLILKIINFLIFVYGMVVLFTFIIQNFKDVLEVAQCLAPIITGIAGFNKFALLLLRYNEIFTIIEDLKRLNKKCEF